MTERRVLQVGSGGGMIDLEVTRWVSAEYVEEIEAKLVEKTKDAADLRSATLGLSHARLAAQVWREAAQKFRNLFDGEIPSWVGSVDEVEDAIENFDEVERIADDLDRMRLDQKRKTDEIIESLDRMRPEPDEEPF